MKETYTVKEFAYEIGCSRESVWRWIRKGKLKATIKENRLIIPYSELKRITKLISQF